MDVILTNMCLIADKEGRILVQNREKKDWPGLTFPGGHVQEGESSLASVIREIREETGLTLNKVVPVGYYEWLGAKREVSLLYYCDDYAGTLVPSSEGAVFFLRPEDLSRYAWSADFNAILNVYAAFFHR